MAKDKTYTTRVTIRLTGKMHTLLTSELTNGQDMAEHIRKVLREHLDESEAIRGNRRAQRQVVQQETLRIRWYVVLLITLVANIGSVLITNLIDIAEKDKDHFTPNGLLRHAEEEASQYGWRILDRVESAIEQGKLIQLNPSDRERQ